SPSRVRIPPSPPLAGASARGALSMQASTRGGEATMATEDVGKLLLRLSLGVLILLHGIAKVIGGPGGIIGLVQGVGLPAAFGYLVYVGEVIAPLFVIAGFWTRPAALIIAINMIVAVLLVHTADIFTLTATGGWAL